jgi:hypothetical protein
MIRDLAMVVLVSACADPKLGDPCTATPTPGGTAAIALGAAATPLVSGQDLAVQKGPQGLYMFVTNARVTGLDVGAGGRAAMVEFTATLHTGEIMSVDPGCRVLELARASDGTSQLTEPYWLALLPTVTSEIEGAQVTIDLVVRDHAGTQAVATADVVAHLPPPM